MTHTQNPSSWVGYIPYLWTPPVLRMLFLGFSAGLPFFLIFSSLSLWLREAGVERSEVTYFSWAALGYSFKFIWAPLIGRLPLPFLSGKLGQRRSWLIFAQLMVVGSIVFMAMIDPASENALPLMAVAAIVLGFSSATQDIVVDAYRIESGNKTLQALMSSMYVTGYRIGLLASGAGALYLAEYLGSGTDNYNYTAWQITYLTMAALMLVGIITSLIIPEPEQTESNRNQDNFRSRDHLRILATFAGAVSAFVLMFWSTSSFTAPVKSLITDWSGNRILSSTLTEGVRLLVAVMGAYLVARILILSRFANQTMVNSLYVAPVTDFFSRYNVRQILLLLALISLYRISDIVLGVIANVFYQDMGFTKPEIATVVKTFGLVMSLLGGVLGGLIALRLGLLPALFLGALLSAATNILFVLLAATGKNTEMLYIVIAADNLSAGLATAAFVAFLSNLVNISFTTMQYAIFSSVMTLFPKILGGYSGTIVDSIGYPQFFIFTFFLGLPVLFIILALGLDKTFRAKPENPPEASSISP